MSHLVPGRVASTPRTIWLSHETDGEAPFSLYETGNPVDSDQSFLLIVCTHRIITVPNMQTKSHAWEVAWDTQIFQHIAECAPHRCRYGGQRATLGSIVTPRACAREAGAFLPSSPCRHGARTVSSSAHERMSGVQSLRIPMSTSSKRYFRCLPRAFISKAVRTICSNPSVRTCSLRCMRMTTSLNRR